MAHPRWYQVDFDHEALSGRSVEHLVSLGHQRIAYMGFPHHEGFVRGLRGGFREAHVRLLGREPDPALIGEFEDEVGPNAERIRSWLAMPEGERPTGFAVGAGNKAWQALELCLAETGRKLSDEPGSFSAAGITSSPFALMFGDALAYQAIEIDNLARFVTPALIHAIDRANDVERIHRFRPDLTPAVSLHVSVAAPLRASKVAR